MSAPGTEFHVPQRRRAHRVRRQISRVPSALARFVVASLRGTAWLVWNPAISLGATRTTHLIECPSCGSDHVCPVESEVVDDARWRVFLRCGGCDAWRDVIVSHDDAARLERAVGQHVASIERAVARLDSERMAMEVDAFVAALECDLIDASSFLR
jgi:formate dehydrogenase maturation protein FdhE